MKRFAAVSLALLYALPATWALQGGLDLVRSPRVESAPDGKCAPHGCGCEESARVRNACCCAPVPGSPAPASALEASRCAGTEAATVTLLTPPVLPAAFACSDVPTALAAPALPCNSPSRMPLASPPDKVPIG